MAILIQADRKATVVQITTPYNVEEHFSMQNISNLEINGLNQMTMPGATPVRRIRNWDYSLWITKIEQ